MKRRLIFVVLIVVSSVGLITAYNNCGNVLFTQETKYGGVVGNPYSSQTSQEILFAICSVLDRCQGPGQVPFNTCMSGVSATNGFGQKLGLPAGVYDPYSSIESAESQGTISANLVSANTCVDTINNLSCSDPLVQAAYNSAQPNPFSNVPGMIPATCNNVFTPVQSSCPKSSGPAFVVNDLGDATDSTPGDHICATAAGTCTLRAAVLEANADGAGTYNIVVPQGTILLGSSLPLNNNINIYGACSGGQTIIDGQGLNRIFNVNSPNITILLGALTAQNGLAVRGGAVFSNFNANVTVNGVSAIFKNNISTGAGVGGGAIDVEATDSFNCTDCIFDSNQAANDGGGVLDNGASLTLLRTLFVNNVATATSGGGVWAGATTTTITNSTFYNNTSSGGAGVMFNLVGSTNTLINNTFVNNSATGPTGAGAVDTNGGVGATFANNLMYNNTGGWGQCSAVTTSNGGNLVFPAAARCIFVQSADISVMPTLGPLQNNGGFSNSVALLPGSAGIDAGVVGFCPATDQRNSSRLTDGKCDIGAYESP